jgi:hypothetical protein
MLKTKTNLPWLINMALTRGWKWPLRLYALSVKPWSDGPAKEKGYEPWVLRGKEQVRQVARIFNVPEEEIPWDKLNLVVLDTLENGNPVLYFGRKKQRHPNGKIRFVAEIEFHQFVWDVNSYTCRTLATL